MIKSILAIVDNGTASASFLRAVAAYAELHDATLEVAVLTPAPMASPAFAPFGALYVPEFVLMGEDAANVAAVQACLADADCHTKVFGFHDDVGWLAGDLRRSRQVADLMVIGASETWSTPWLRRRVVRTLVQASGTPLLLLPKNANIERINRAVLGWKPSAEATRAMHALIQFAVPEAAIDIVTVGDTLYECERDHDAHAEVKRHLERHDFKAEGHWIVNAQKTEADTLSLYAKKSRADLLAIGGFAHSRIRDIVLGGVTRDLVEHNDRPVLVVG